MDSNLLIEREKEFIDKISNNYKYDSNIRHLLYIIIPAFIIKYGINKEKLILNTFRDIKIISSNKEDKTIRAFYSSTPNFIYGNYSTRKFMVIQNYKDIGLIDLLDNLVHEFNHAINSYKNEIKITKNYLYLRTGLSFRIYEKERLTFIKKDNSFILEEIINTKQTEDVINIIKNIKSTNRDIENTIYAINSETNHTYNSNSYYLQSAICKEILNNRTFISTLEKLRIDGEVYDINKWFNDITGSNTSYKELTNYLYQIYQLEIEYSKKRFFKEKTLNKIKNISNKIIYIIDRFNNNVNFK